MSHIRSLLLSAWPLQVMALFRGELVGGELAAAEAGQHGTDGAHHNKQIEPE